MKRFTSALLILVIILMFSGISLAAGPYLVCNPVAGATQYNVTGLPVSVPSTELNPESTGTFGFKLDLSALPSGSYTVKAQACANDAIWGTVCSADSSPFSFTRPAALTVPTGLGLVK